MSADSNMKLFGKIKMVDILVVVVIIVSVAGVWCKYNQARSVMPLSEADDMELVFHCRSVPEYSAMQMQPGDLVLDQIKKVKFGNVKDIRIAESVNYTVSNTGELVASACPGYVSALITVDAKGIYHDTKTVSGITFDNTDYWSGRDMQFRVGNIAMFGMISEIKKKE